MSVVRDLRHYDHHEYHYEPENRPDLSKEYRYVETNILNPAKDPVTGNYNTEFVKAEYNENSTQPIVLKGKHYKVWVERARVPSTNIPLMNWLRDYYYIYIEDNTAVPVTDNQVVDYIPVSNINPGFEGAEYIWTMWQIVEMIQDSIDTACFNLGIASAPKIVFDENTELFSIIYPNNNWEQGGSFQLYFNHNLFDLFQNIPYLEVEKRRDPLSVANAGKEILLPAKDLGNNVSGGVYTMSQCHKTINLFYELSKIVVTTSMNVRNSRVGGINLNNTTIQNASNSTTRLGVLTTFDFQYDDLTSTDLQYQPKNPRIIDILAKDEIIDVNYTFNYLTKTGRLIPIFLAPDTQADLMLGFRSMD